MTKLEALNQILNIIIESEKEGRTILEAINLTAQAYGGKGDSTNNAVAIKELYDIFTETKTQLTPANIKKGKTVLGVEGDYWNIKMGEKQISGNPITSLTTGYQLSNVSSFQNLSSLTSLDLSNFDTSQVTNMNSMFFNCSSLTNLDLSNFGTSQVTRMGLMFQSCPSLTSLDLSNFDTSQVTNMDSMFFNCPSLTSLTIGPNWASNNSIYSFDLSSCPLTKESVLDVLNKLADRTATTNKPTLKLKSTVKALLSDDEIKIATDKGWTVA